MVRCRGDSTRGNHGDYPAWEDVKEVRKMSLGSALYHATMFGSKWSKRSRLNCIIIWVVLFTASWYITGLAPQYAVPVGVVLVYGGCNHVIGLGDAPQSQNKMRKDE